MKQTLKDNRGFTLIEMLLVIMIVAVLASVAVGGYTSYRRSALLDLSVDSVGSQLSELRSRVETGQVGAERLEQLRAELISGDESQEDKAGGDLKCRGVYIQRVDDAEFEISRFEQNFVNKQVWNVFDQQWAYQGCGPFSNVDPEIEFEPLELDGEVLLIGAAVDGSELALDAVVRFAPPEGAIEYRVDGADFLEAEESKIMTLTWQYGEVDRADLKRILNYDLLSGTVSRSLTQ